MACGLRLRESVASQLESVPYKTETSKNEMISAGSGQRSDLIDNDDQAAGPVSPKKRMYARKSFLIPIVCVFAIGIAVVGFRKGFLGGLGSSKSNKSLECSSHLSLSSLRTRMPSVLKEVIGESTPAKYSVAFSPASKCWGVTSASPVDFSVTAPPNQQWQGFTAYLHAVNGKWKLVTYGTAFGGICTQNPYPKPGSEWYVPKEVLCR